MKNVGFIKNCTIEEIVENSFEKALKIPDGNVIHDEERVGFIINYMDLIHNGLVAHARRLRWVTFVNIK